MVDDARRLQPDARIRGVTVERMHKSNFGRELMIGVIRDPVFGPVISFGSGGTSVEVLRDRAVALPPLDEVIIEGMVARTRVARTLKRFRNMPAVDEEALEQVLLRVSEMVCELPEIREMDINPLIIDERGLVAVDARIKVDLAEPGSDRYAHMAIHPYPADLVGHYHTADGTRLTIRPIRPEDAKIEQEFVRRLSPESRYFRFMQAVSELTPQMLVRFTQIDYDREMALIAVREDEDGGELQVAVARYTVDPDRKGCEFALTVADEWQGQGIGYHLMSELMEVGRSRGLDRIHGEVLASNHNMMGLMKRLGFEIRTSPDDADLKLVSHSL
jgi:acetyltransferase